MTTRTSVTVFRLRASAKSHFSAFVSGLGVGLLINGNQDARLYPIEGAPKLPAWAERVQQALLPVGTQLALTSTSPSALLVWPQGAEIYVVSFGHAWMRLQHEWLVSNFGRTVALNVLARNELREVISEQVMAKKHRASERAPIASVLQDFNFESDRDLVFSVEGVCDRPPFTGIIRGGLGLRVEVDLSAFDGMIQAINAQLLVNYQSKFPDIDNLVIVDSLSEIAQLDGELDKEMAAGNRFANISSLPPALYSGSDVGFVLGRWSKKAAFSRSLEYNEWLAYLGKHGGLPSVATAKATPVTIVDVGTNEQMSRQWLFSNFSFDVSTANGKFILYGGDWYSASTNLLGKLSSFRSKIMVTTSSALKALPSWNGKDWEGVYNQNTCTAIPGLFFMDARNVQYGGVKSKFEFCDFFDDHNRVLYFVKRASSAGGMSHLYEQVRRTVELFFGSNSAYMSKLDSALKKHHPSSTFAWATSLPRGLDWDICLVIMGKTVPQLSTFPQCGLMRLHRDIEPRVKSFNVISV